MAAIDKYLDGIKEKINQIQSALDIENSKIKRKKLLQEKALYQFFCLSLKMKHISLQNKSNWIG